MIRTTPSRWCHIMGPELQPPLVLQQQLVHLDHLDFNMWAHLRLHVNVHLDLHGHGHLSVGLVLLCRDCRMIHFCQMMAHRRQAKVQVHLGLLSAMPNGTHCLPIQSSTAHTGKSRSEASLAMRFLANCFLLGVWRHRIPKRVFSLRGSCEPSLPRKTLRPNCMQLVLKLKVCGAPNNNTNISWSWLGHHCHPIS